MKLVKQFFLFIAVSIISFQTIADEGMWLPMHISRLNQADMQKLGLKLTAEEIYSVNKSSLKDAIVQFNRGCTGEIISNEGLLLTNHHCAYGIIQANSSVEKDYLTNGFWAYSKDQEIPAQGVSVSFLVRMEDVTSIILSKVNNEMSYELREQKIRAVSDSLQKINSEDKKYDVTVRNFFDGNEYYMFIYETFNDIRLVGAPPSSIGKFGGDTDNWMWPRHTGDFSLLRVYANKDNQPAEYSVDNVPYKPKHFLPINIKGVEKDDFAMILGYPGRTDRYLTSFGVQQAIEKRFPASVKIRGERLAIMKEYMDESDQVRIQYSSKYARISNYYKNFQGQIKALKANKIIEQKQDLEEKFQKWADASGERKMYYGNALNDIKEGFEIRDKYLLEQVYLSEAVLGSELLSLAGRFYMLNEALEKGESAKADNYAKYLTSYIENHFKDYSLNTDKDITAALLKMYYNDISKENHCAAFTSLVSKSKSDFDLLANNLFGKSIFSSKEKLTAFLKSPSSKVLSKDPAFILINGFINQSENIFEPYANKAEEKINTGMRIFVEGLRKMDTEKKYYPNANFTMRLTYGTVQDYFPRDAVYYNYYTTIEGIMEKEDATNDEFVVPEKLKELYKKKDYGQYGKDGNLNVCFITNNDITGGNSGSPVINANGELIGCAFDGNWEAMSGDITFEPLLQRTIVVDARYILFIIDKYANAQNIINELKIVKN
jgi:hypothetical protein